jgi:hypothetical protein
MAFMQHQITAKCNWLKVETSQGTEFVAGNLVTVRDSEPKTHPLSKAKREEYKKAIWEFTEGEPESWENVQGYGARLSAPGYMDCTEWSVFDTYGEAREYLMETYGDEDEDEDGE